MIKIEMKEKFTNALKSHDWFFDFSDDHSVWTRGRDERDSLVAMGKHLVATKEMTSAQVANLWNKFAPNRFQSKPPQFEAPRPKPQRRFINRPPRPKTGEVVALKKELGCSASEANFRLSFGVEPSELERKIADKAGGRFILHFASHPEIWEWA